MFARESGRRIRLRYTATQLPAVLAHDGMTDLNEYAAGRERLNAPTVAAALAGRQRASELLLAIARAPGDRLTVDELLAGLGDRTFGLLLLVLAIINVLPQPPGGSVVFGLLLALIALQLLLGLGQPWVPGFIRRRSMSRAKFGAGLDRVLPALHRVERLCQPRVSWLTTGLFERLAGFAIVLFAVIITLPIPVIGNVLPGIAVAIIAIGLIEGDGLALLTGVGIGVAALTLIVGLFGAAAVAFV